MAYITETGKGTCVVVQGWIAKKIGKEKFFVDRKFWEKTELRVIGGVKKETEKAIFVAVARDNYFKTYTPIDNAAAGISGLILDADRTVDVWIPKTAIFNAD